MKLFGKKREKTDAKNSGESPESASQTTTSAPQTIAGANSNKLNSVTHPKLSKPIKILLFIVIVGIMLAGGIAGYSTYKYRRHISEIESVNKSMQNNDTTQALVHARKALAQNPNDFQTIQLVASLSEKSNPREAHKLYAQALDIYKKHDNPDIDGKPANTYWGAADFAEKAGLNDQAKKYYQKVLKAVDPHDYNQQILYMQAEAALKRLQ